ncbi:MAG: hypothetical protein JST69_02995 [Bacteroidetes bacterium]|nr:hypothetical protein [Bacteroidota bacterium]
MQTLGNILSLYELSTPEIDKLSNEAKMVSVDYGKKGIIKKLSPETWNLFEAISDQVWSSALPIVQKISLGFQLYETFPSYYHFLIPFYRGVSKKEIIQPEEKKMIWIHFMKYLAAPHCYADPVGYVLWANFFEDEILVREAWQGLINNYTDKKSLLKLIEVAGPVPFSLKEIQYNNLLKDPTTHEFILESLLHSADDVHGQIDMKKAHTLLAQLKIDTETENYKLLKEKLK